MKNLLFYIGLPHLKIKPLRALLTLLGVAFGIALYVAISIINHSTRNSMRESMEAIAGRAKLTVSAGPLGFSEKKIPMIEKVSGVRFAVPMVEARAYFAEDGKGAGSLFVLGVDLLREQSVRSYKTTEDRIMDDPLVFFNQPDSIIITRKLAQSKGLQINSKLSLATANGARRFTVRGILEPEGAARAYGGSLAVMDLDGARARFGRGDRIDRVDIVPREGFSIDGIKQDLATVLGPAFKIETPESQSKRLDSLLATYQMILTFFSSIALLAGLFLIVNSISIAVAERRVEIGTLRALGATRGSMVVLFVVEVIGLGVFGSVLGCGIGRGLAELLSKQVIAAIAAQFQTEITVSRLQFSFTDAGIAVLIGTLSSVLAAFWPSLRAGQVHPLEAMKGYPDPRARNGATFARRLAYAGAALLVWVTLSSFFGLGKDSLILDALTKAGSVIGVAAFGPFLVIFCLKALERIPRGTYPAVFHFAHENLLRNPKRTISNVMTLLVGLFLVMLISTIRTSFHDTLMGWLDQTFVSDLLVSSSGRVATSEIQPLQEGIQTEILKIPGIRPVGKGRGTATRFIRSHYQGEEFSLRAMDRFADFYEGKYISAIGSDARELITRLHEGKKPSVLASVDFLQKHHKHEGDLLELETPDGPCPFRIVGVISEFAPGGILYMDRKIYKKYWKDSLVSAFAFNVASGYSMEQVRSEIDRKLGRKRNLLAISNGEFKAQTHQAIEQSFAYTRAIEVIALIVGMLGLLNTLLISVMERTREIGMLRAVGSTQGQISQMIFMESFLQGFLGACVAVVSGAYIAWLFVKYNLVDSLGWVIDFHVALPSILSTLAAGIGVSILAGYLPARKASRLVITEALDYE